jgi:hypothetical protein
MESDLCRLSFGVRHDGVPAQVLIDSLRNPEESLLMESWQRRGKSGLYSHIYPPPDLALALEEHGAPTACCMGP